MTTRRLGPDDEAASLRLSAEAFGERPPSASPPPPSGPEGEPRTWPPEGIVAIGTFDADGELVAKLNGRPYESWFHGGRVPTFGVAGVTVAAEHRGEGLLSPLMERVLAEGRRQGAAVSTLFPTAPGIYRRFGYELVAEQTTVSVPAAALQRLARADGIRTRRARESDFAAVRHCYDRWGAQRNGPLTRDGVMFPADASQWLGSFTGVTLAVDADDTVQGFASWRRGPGYGADARITAEDLIWTTGAARDALLSALGSFAPVTPTAHLESSGTAELELALPVTATGVVERSPYMLRVLDVGAAFRAVHPAPPVGGSVTFSVVGDAHGGTDGTYRLEVEAGEVGCETSTQEPSTTFSPRGLALLWSGALPHGRVVEEGLATPPTSAADGRIWDALGLARPLHVRDYF